MPNGSVKFFNAAKGFGFITSDSGGKDIFVPTASLTSSGISTLKPGQRLSFEEVPDGKGPIAVELKLVPDPPKSKVEMERPSPPFRTEARPKLTFYHDHTSDWSCHALAEVRAAGYDPVIVEYLATPPTKDELKALSGLLGASNQSLVRKYDPLFLELRLDDRFIGDGEFWDAIVEHPTLINGPLMAKGTKATVCDSDEAIDLFFSASTKSAAQPAAKPKGLSERALRILAGDVVPPAAKPVELKPIDEKPIKGSREAKGSVVPAPIRGTAAKSETTKKAKVKVSASPVIKKGSAKSKPEAKVSTKVVKKPKKTARKTRK